jgi:hypothetical protein
MLPTTRLFAHFCTDRARGVLLPRIGLDAGAEREEVMERPARRAIPGLLYLPLDVAVLRS